MLRWLIRQINRVANSVDLPLFFDLILPPANFERNVPSLNFFSDLYFYGFK